VKDPRNEKFERLREDATTKQLERLRNHPHVPEDFDWQDYIFINSQLKAKNINNEFLALRHWLKQGRKTGLQYKIDEFSVEAITVHRPEKANESIEFFYQNIEANEFIETKNKKVIYTCISGDYDNLKDIGNYDDSWDYICFTNLIRPGRYKKWEIREIPKILNFLDQTKRARALKILPHLFLPEYETSIWIDGTVEIINSPQQFMQKFLTPQDIFAVSAHPDRICVYQERDACIKFKKDDEKILIKQTEIYKNEGYPENWGMVQTGIIYRKNVKEVRFLCNMWWEQVLKYSKRDQISFNYVLWKYPINIKPLNSNIICSDYFWLWTHNSSIAKKVKIRKDYGQLQNFINGKPI
jgi:hypothetical protein